MNLSILKLAASFGSKKDTRGFASHVQIIEADRTTLYCSEGHITIKITCENFSRPMPMQLTIESIERAYKVKELGLLTVGEFDTRFPSFDKIFKENEPARLESATFDCKSLLIIAKAL